MKRKLLIFVLTIFSLVTLSFNMVKTKAVSCSDYQRFTSITPSSGKLLVNYSETELKTYIKATKKKRFSGWRISYINKRSKCNFLSETILSIFNTGTTPIKYKVSEVDSKVVKTSVSCTGSIGYKMSGDVKKFKHNLDTSLKMQADYSVTVDVKTTENLEIDIDPGTKAVMYLQGTGYLTNGYARYYSFWITQMAGGFEFFEITDIYPKIVKVKI